MASIVVIFTLSLFRFVGSLSSAVLVLLRFSRVCREPAVDLFDQAFLYDPISFRSLSTTCDFSLSTFCFSPGVVDDTLNVTTRDKDTWRIGLVVIQSTENNTVLGAALFSVSARSPSFVPPRLVKSQIVKLNETYRKCLFLYFHTVILQFYTDTRIDDFAVNKSYRRRGVGKLLYACTCLLQPADLTGCCILC